MSSVFTKVIEGEFPARFIYKDDDVVSFLTINPVVPGHVLVVPKQEIENWTDLDDATYESMMKVVKKVGRAIDSSFDCEKVGMEIVGLEVPHVHVHLMPVNSPQDVDLSLGDPSPAPELLDAVQAKLIAALDALTE